MTCDKPKATDFLWGIGGIILGIWGVVSPIKGLHTLFVMIVGFGTGIRYLYRGFCFLRSAKPDNENKKEETMAGGKQS